MRISDIKPYPVWVSKRNQLVVKVETDEGLSGLGESGLSGGFTEAMKVAGGLPRKTGNTGNSIEQSLKQAK